MQYAELLSTREISQVHEKSMEILRSMVNDGKLDQGIVNDIDTVFSDL